jgi:hypothetical protein
VTLRLRRVLARRRCGVGARGRIFGIGLSRTGTSSLTAALERLGLHAVHFPADPATRERIGAHLAGEGGRLRLPILAEVDGITDSPAAACFEALDRSYPGSRFVLTTRERESWLASCERYWTRGVEPFLRDTGDQGWRDYVEALSKHFYGVAHFDAAAFARAYDAHDARVRGHFTARPGSLLELDICGGQGWDELCGFLGRPVPEEPFPWQNRVPA